MWRPGDPVKTAKDREEYALWRRYSMLKCQRARRERLKRVDYYASPDAAAVLNGLKTESRDSDSNILNAIILAWAERAG
jgi:hypothetical protein